ncbi:DUF3365 domain-containing protein [Halorutilales archaeon Cl-col2-1]
MQMSTRTRRLLIIAAVSVLVALAGCQGGNGGASVDDATSETGQGTENVDSDAETDGDGETTETDTETGDGNEMDAHDRIGSLSENEFETKKAQAENASKRMMSTLSGRLQSAMKEGGPTRGIEVCTDDAIEIKHNISRETGWQVTRVSDKVRDPLLGTPDPWEQRSFEKMKKAVAEGKDPANVSRAEVVDEPNGEYLRYMSPIPTRPVCTNCHGTQDQISPEVEELLDEHYPHDEATGYEVGELRGAVSVKMPLNESTNSTDTTMTME